MLFITDAEFQLLSDMLDTEAPVDLVPEGASNIGGYLSADEAVDLVLSLMEPE
jgi:hypothetical protein